MPKCPQIAWFLAASLFVLGGTGAALRAAASSQSLESIQALDAAPAPKVSGTAATSPILLSDAPENGLAVVATFRYHLPWLGIKTAKVADIWNPRFWRVGLRDGDELVRIDEKSLAGLGPSAAKRLIESMHKKPKVLIQFRHPDSADLVTVELSALPEGRESKPDAKPAAAKSSMAPMPPAKSAVATSSAAKPSTGVSSTAP